ncbi:MAG: AAA family ATPase, partial [Chloroflexi bacterium]|nr:AAA family ATPase [Chloroflexota bacterium]
MQRTGITDNLDAFIDVFPTHIADALQKVGDLDALLEVIMDFGRLAEARYGDRNVRLSEKEVSLEDIHYVTSKLSAFGDDNRAGIERTLHRISAIRNRKGDIIGLSCRVGRAVFGTIKIIEDIVQSNKSILLSGRPGVGKTTMLREIARVLSDEMGKRVVIVDTSNEIAGDGDIPHPAIGLARRMQVAKTAAQHAVMIEAVENHMPEVIIIDEIGNELEAVAARTIAERGVQLIGTAHGNTLENLLINPTLSDLIGGVQAVTLGDEEAKRRGTQKTILERKSPPTFNVVVDIVDRYAVAIHHDTAAAVDSQLRNGLCNTEMRHINNDGKIEVSKSCPAKSLPKTT